MALKVSIKEEVKVFAHFMGNQIKQPNSIIEDVAYAKVDELRGDKSLVTFDLLYTLSDGQSWSREFSFSPDLDGGNFIEQSYQYLKTLEEFSSAVDC